ncbi:MAG: mechanosensitive ion channel family protein [Pseudomonadales bacterium]
MNPLKNLPDNLRRSGREHPILRHVLILLLCIAAVLLLILSVPISDVMRGQILNLLGIVITAVIALSSTTFVANAMAGILLTLIKSYRIGDFIRIGEQFGRVTERGLFHTEIQTEDRDLTTFPNLYLATNPLTVVSGSGTVISTVLSLGYDLPHSRVETLLLQAAIESGLEDPFVQVTELGDFAVTYKACGFLREVKQLLSAKSLFKKKVLDVLHSNGVEIASPTIMNQRPIGNDVQFIPEAIEMSPRPVSEQDSTPENVMFDKADVAEKMELLIEQEKQLEEKIEALKKEAESPEREQKLGLLESELGEVLQQIAELGEAEN